jgi:hypothetical protein
MRRFAFVLVGVWLVLLPPRTAVACPSCAEAVPQSSGAEEEDQVRLARAYNHSIYLMVGMPYFLLGTVGYLIYRRLRVASPATPLPGRPAQPLPPEDNLSALPGDSACSLPSRGGVS